MAGTSEARSAASALEYAIGALRSTQDVLLHKVERTQLVRDQLEINRTAIAQLKEALGYDPR